MIGILFISYFHFEIRYSVDKEHACDIIVQMKGSPMLKQYKYSFPAALAAIYPGTSFLQANQLVDHKWCIWKFYRNSHQQPRDIFTEVAKHLNVNKMEDWYSIKREGSQKSATIS